MSAQNTLRRDLGLSGSIVTGLGSIIGTGVFVSISIAAGIAQNALLLAILGAAILAIFNGLSSAQLAANHPVSGGTYEYAYHYLNPTWGFVAGSMFLCAKSASAATAALGFSSYFTRIFQLENSYWVTVSIAMITIVIMTIVVLGGMKRTNIVNTIIVVTTIGSLLFFIVVGYVSLSPKKIDFITVDTSWTNIFHATAIMFVAYTGYGRIATLGEEVKSPEKTIPLAVIFTLIISMLLYSGVGVISLNMIGIQAFSLQEGQAPLEVVAESFILSFASQVMAMGAMMAMLGVLLNLILGLSRVLLAMGRRKDIPQIFAQIDAKGNAPTIAVITVAVIISLLVFVGNLKTTWSFSAFTVLIYYAITNLAACKISKEKRYYPIFVPITGLFSCLFLTLWIDISILVCGVVILLVMFVYKTFVKQNTANL